ncbi:hypothetical protein GGI15_001630 [Coemansia interrupta]|uniref:Myb-like DNA-binding domain containing protein n=1 Tax=Coemansia interrupta TaxID=1126814 RepID=A0A9W8LNP5_9FUNG|nr:hypothetical protein GGI15_001630 [Coemansia interrupta]
MPATNNFEFHPLYHTIVAELSNEELSTVREIVTRNGDLLTKSTLKTLVKAELPLCLDEDIERAIEICMNDVKTKPASSIPPSVQSTPKMLNIPSIPNGLLKPTLPIEKESISKWSDEETNKLYMYLQSVDGRKNWTACARYVGTKTSAQCKAKYNNMRAQELPRNESMLATRRAIV